MPYNTSELYKVAIEKESRVTFMSGEIVTVHGDKIVIENSAIDPSSCYVTNQCVNSDSFEFGSVFAAEAGITLKTEIDRYSLYNADMKLFYNIQVKEGQNEQIPLGVFIINEPNRIGKKITIKAYDRMILLDGNITESVTGTVSDLLLYISVKCGIELAQTAEEIMLFPNGNLLMSVAPDTVSTYRDLLSKICKVTCSFGSFDRNGKLKLTNFATSPTKTVTGKMRTSSKFSDFETFFSSATANFVFEGAYKQYGVVVDGSGLSYDVGDVPIVQGGDITNQAVLDRMFEILSTIKYIPCDFTFNGDPSVDLGDMVVSIDRNGNEIVSLVTFYKWSYRGGHQIKSAGQNPRLSAASDKTTKQMRSLEANVNNKDMVVVTATNPGNLIVMEREVEVASVAFATNTTSSCIIMVTIPIEMEQNGIVTIRQYVDSVEMSGGTIQQFCHEGAGVVTFVNYFEADERSVYRYAVSASVIGVDGSSISGTIRQMQSKVVLFGQGLVATVPWDGMITVSEQMHEVYVSSRRINALSFKDEISMKNFPIERSQFSDVVQQANVIRRNIQVVGMADNVSIT